MISGELRSCGTVGVVAAAAAATAKEEAVAVAAMAPVKGEAVAEIALTAQTRLNTRMSPLPLHILVSRRRSTGTCL